MQRLKLLGALALTVLCAWVLSLLAKIELPRTDDRYRVPMEGRGPAPPAWLEGAVTPRVAAGEPLVPPEVPLEGTPPIRLPRTLPDGIELRLPPLSDDFELRLPPLPDDAPIEYPIETRSYLEEPFPFHLGVLGVTPLLTAMLLIELLAAAVPRWRPRRHGGGVARRPLVRAAFLLAGVLAVIQAFGVAVYARGMGIAAHGMGPTLAIILLSVLGLALLAGAMWLSSRFGVANGFVVFVVFLAIPIWLPQLLHTWGAEDREYAWHFILVGVAATVAVLTLRPDGRRLPISGLLPLTIPIQVAGLVALVAALTVPDLMNITHPSAAVRTVLIGVMAVGIPWLALRRRPHTPSSTPGDTRRSLAKRAQRVPMAHSLALSAAYIAVLYAINALASPNPSLLAVGQEFILIATTTAAIWDVLAELDARWRHGPLVAAWPFHDVDAAERVAAALTARGIPAFLRTHRLHTLVRILGPWFATELMVPPAAVELARQLAETDHAQPALAAAAEALA